MEENLEIKLTNAELMFLKFDYLNWLEMIQKLHKCWVIFFTMVEEIFEIWLSELAENDPKMT